MKLRNNKQLRDRIASMESENAEVRVDGQEQTSVVQQNQTQTSENDRQRETDLRSVELGTAGIMDIIQIGLMFTEMHTSLKEMESRLKDRIEENMKEMQVETQSRLEESMKEMENRLKDSQKG